MSPRRRRRLPPPDRSSVDAVVTRRVALARRLGPDDRDLLVDRTLQLVGSIGWEGVGLELTPEMVVTVAANAALPVLRLGPGAYRGVRAVIIRAGPAPAAGATHTGPVDGVVRSGGTVVGEAFGGTGPLSLDWHRALADSVHPRRGHNLVIHEFAHKIDSADGWSDGRPPLARDRAARWDEVFADEYGHTDDRESDAVLDPYAWQSPAEFFAVATETYFCRPDELAAAKPGLFEVLAAFYGVDLRRA